VKRGKTFPWIATSCGELHCIVMPHYYINLECRGTFSGEHGFEAASLKDAQIEGVRALADMLRDHAEDLIAKGACNLTITQDEDAVVYQVTVNGFQDHDADRSAFLH
jgi:hypothetical protein